MQEIFGYVAAILTTFCFVPQALKIIREKKAEGVSLPMYVIFATGVLLWLVYGLMTMQWPVILANLVTFILVLVIIVTLLKYRDKEGG